MHDSDLRLGSKDTVWKSVEIVDDVYVVLRFEVVRGCRFNVPVQILPPLRKQRHDVEERRNSEQENQATAIHHCTKCLSETLRLLGHVNNSYQGERNIDLKQKYNT